MIRGRNDSVPIVVLSSRGDEAGKVQALDLGADDYLTKPFGMDELLARMRAALRHQLQVHGERPVFRSGDLSVDLVRRIVKVGDREVKLSPKEYELLRVLVQHAGKVLTHRFLLNELWDELTNAQYLRVYVRQLRQKINPIPNARNSFSPRPVSAIGCVQQISTKCDRVSKLELLPVAMINFSPPGGASWHANILGKRPPRLDAR